MLYAHISTQLERQLWTGFSCQKSLQQKSEAGSKLSFELIAKDTGMSKVMLSTVSSQRRYTATTDAIEMHCTRFDCSVRQIREDVPDPVFHETAS